MPTSPREILRALALAHPDVEEALACKGTALESSAFKVRKKTFLFARDVEMMIKLDESLPEARRLAAQGANDFRVGAGGWVSVKFGAGKLPAKELLSRWIAESSSIHSGRDVFAHSSTVSRR